MRKDSNLERRLIANKSVLFEVMEVIIWQMGNREETEICLSNKSKILKKPWSILEKESINDQMMLDN